MSKKKKTPEEISKDLDNTRKKCLKHVDKCNKAWSLEEKNFSKKLIDWTSILEKDWDSEPENILIILQYKLRRTRQQLVKNNLTMDTKKMEKEILLVEKLLEKVVKDEYLENLRKPLKKKYGNMKMIFGKRGSKIPNTVTCDFVWTKAKSQKVANNAYKNILDKSYKARKDDLDKAFCLLAKNIWGWWD